MSWNRTHYLTLGFLMMFVGCHFRIVESFVLTPQTTSFIKENSEGGFGFGGDTYSTTDMQNPQMNNLFSPQYQQASYSAPWQNAGFNNEATVEKKTVTPPTWLGWPMICVGAVLWLFGFTAPNP